MESKVKKAGRPRLHSEALTKAERDKRHRDKLKASGGKKMQLTLSPELVAALTVIEKRFYPGLGAEVALKAMLHAEFARITEMLTQSVRLVEDFDQTEEVRLTYLENEENRRKPLSAERYLELSTNRIIKSIKEAN